MLHIRSQDRFAVLAQYLPEDPIIVEAGAFYGQDTLRMATQWPQATIYAFEPVPEIFARLQETVAGSSIIHPVPLALGSSTGTAAFWPSENPKRPGKLSQAGSLLPPKERLTWSAMQFHEPIQVATITLDDWVAQQQLSHVDLLWLDMQGYELPVMQASPHTLAGVRAIWTEVHFVEAYAGQATYPEVTQWLNQQGFTLIGTDFTNTTDWFFGTALFVRTID